MNRHLDNFQKSNEERKIRDRRESAERYFDSASTFPLHKCQSHSCIQEMKSTVLASFGGLSFQVLVALSIVPSVLAILVS